ncbi:hypothetical protein CCHR01_13294 [Colletotrichum chrysophilum]|uniref:Uncharacterized protein n=1 Tax=Colletotrichum chrysophilum TaxID=1836956 RepID=A0AAD9ABN1_9PEZI|nr:hypothetical protein CCHR01_13294 [Colletotrichum chrysophilum]
MSSFRELRATFDLPVYNHFIRNFLCQDTLQYLNRRASWLKEYIFLHTAAWYKVSGFGS